MVNFYQVGQRSPISQTLSGKLSWSHISILVGKLKDKTEPLSFYAKKSVEQGWSVRVLEHQIELKNFERTTKNQINFKATFPKKSDAHLSTSVKDEFTERDLEQALLKKINAFLIEMGGVFTWVGNQYQLTVDGDDFFVDVLLFHRRLRYLVAIELKIGEFKPEYAGKMQFYLTALND